MYSCNDTACAVGCPIRISTDQSLLAAPHGFSQRATSFIASWCQGIHRMPFLCSRPAPGSDPGDTMHRNHPQHQSSGFNRQLSETTATVRCQPSRGIDPCGSHPSLRHRVEARWATHTILPFSPASRQKPTARSSHASEHSPPAEGALVPT